MGFGILFILPVIICLGMLAGCVTGLIFLWYRVLRNPKSGKPTCPQCGYLVEGLTTLVCPECGNDFREIGIDTPKQRGFPGPGVFVTLWTLLWPLPSLVVCLLLVAVGPKSSATHVTITLSPKSAQYARVQLTTMPYQGSLPFLSSTQPRWLNVYFFNQGGTMSQAVMDLETMTQTQQSGQTVQSLQALGYATAASPVVAQTSGLDRSVLEPFMKSVGADVTSQEVQAEAEELVQYILSSQTEGFPSRSFSSFTVVNHATYPVSHPALWFILLLSVLWIACWVNGILLYVRIRRRRLA